MFPIVPSIGPARPAPRPMGAVPPQATTSPPTNLEEIGRQMAREFRERAQATQAGTKYVVPCGHCRDTTAWHDSEQQDCICMEKCAWPDCPSDVVRIDPVVYSEGFAMPSIPAFKEVC